MATVDRFTVEVLRYGARIDRDNGTFRVSIGVMTTGHEVQKDDF